MNNKQKILIVIITILFLVHVTSALLWKKGEKVEAKEDFVEEKEEPTPALEEHYKVDIKGQVNKPGVYDVLKGARVMDVIHLAGGLKKEANTDFLNLSKKVEDGSVIWVYTTKEIEKLKEVKTVTEYLEKECNCPDVSNSACVTRPNSNSGTNSSKVNINTASLEELTTLSGIGESKAKAILEYRKKKPFEKIEDIKNVSGIGDSAYEKIKDFIIVS